MTVSHPPMIVDLQVRAVDLACRLGSLIYFLEAAEELLTCRKASTSYFRRHCRKIVTLVEIARKTLKVAGVQQHLFSPCPAPLAPHKTAYVDLLFLLRERRSNIDPALEARVKGLLLPLSSGFSITRTGEASSSDLTHGSPTRQTKTTRRLNGQGASNTVASLVTDSVTVPITFMPPPDAFPAAPSAVSGPIARRILGSWSSLIDDEELYPRHPHSSKPDEEQELFSQPLRLARPLRTRLGIFCTPKTSMFQYSQPTPSPRTVQAIKE